MLSMFVVMVLVGREVLEVLWVELVNEKQSSLRFFASIFAKLLVMKSSQTAVSVRLV